MRINDDENGRLLSYLTGIYEIFFGYIACGGVIGNAGIPVLLRAGLAFFLAGVGLHFFVNIDHVVLTEYRRKSTKLGLGILAVFGGIAVAASISEDALVSHLFFVVYLMYITMQFLYFGVFRKSIIAGALSYGVVRFLGVGAGAVAAGQIIVPASDKPVVYIVGSYVLFHIICEFLRWTASIRGTRVAIMSGFIAMVALITFMFYRSAIIVPERSSKMIVMGLTLLLLIIVSIPPLVSIRNMKASALLNIFPWGLAGGIVLTIIQFEVLKKDRRLVWLLVVPALIIAFNFRFGTSKEEGLHELGT